MCAPTLGGIVSRAAPGNCRLAAVGSARSGQKLLPIDDLHDAVPVGAIAEVHLFAAGPAEIGPCSSTGALAGCCPGC